MLCLAPTGRLWKKKKTKKTKTEKHSDLFSWAPIEQLANNLDGGPCNTLTSGEGAGTAQTTHKNMTGGMMDEGHESQFSRANKTSPSCVTTIRLMGRKLADVDCRLDSGRIPTGSGRDVGMRHLWLVSRPARRGGQLRRREGEASRV